MKLKDLPVDILKRLSPYRLFVLKFVCRELRQKVSAILREQVKYGVRDNRTLGQYYYSIGPYGFECKGSTPEFVEWLQQFIRVYPWPLTCIAKIRLYSENQRKSTSFSIFDYRFGYYHYENRCPCLKIRMDVPFDSQLKNIIKILCKIVSDDNNISAFYLISDQLNRFIKPHPDEHISTYPGLFNHPFNNSKVIEAATDSMKEIMENTVHYLKKDSSRSAQKDKIWGIEFIGDTGILSKPHYITYKETSRSYVIHPSEVLFPFKKSLKNPKKTKRTQKMKTPKYKGR